MLDMTHKQFIELCKHKGILVNEITQDKVIVNSCVTHELIDFDLFDDEFKEKRTIRQLLKEGNNIGLVKIVKKILGMDLKLCIQFIDNAKPNWFRNLVVSIPFEEIPLHLNDPTACDDYKQALLKRFK